MTERFESNIKELEIQQAEVKIESEQSKQVYEASWEQAGSKPN